jgi:uncharacterized protein
MDAVISIVLVIGIFLGAGFALGQLSPNSFSARWLMVAALLMLINDAALTRLYGLLPDPFVTSSWNWMGKLLALGVTLLVASLPVFGWRRVGLTLCHDRARLPLALIVSAALLTLFTLPALLSQDEAAARGTIAFQLTMPGFEEEPFYRGILLFALGQAFAGRWAFLGIEWSWGAVLSAMIFGLAHAFSWQAGAIDFDLITFAVTGIPALLLVWLRERTGSLLLPVLLHNYANSIGLFI